MAGSADDGSPHQPSRGRRRFGSAVTALLALLTVAAVVLCVHSYRACPTAAFFTPGGTVHAATFSRGTLLVVLTDLRMEGRGLSVAWASVTPREYGRAMELLDGCATTNRGALGFGYAVGDLRPPYGWRFLSLRAPAWVVVVAPLGLLSVRRLAGPLRRRRRRSRGLCPSCGYDLRGSGGRCPECGSADRVTT